MKKELNERKDKEQVKSTKVVIAVCVVAVIIIAVKLWSDFNYDLNIIEMSKAEASQNLIVDLIGVGFAVLGMLLMSVLYKKIRKSSK